MLIVSPRGHCMLCPYTFAVYVILNQRSTPEGAKVNKVKNLSIRVIRYFTALRSVQYDTCAWFVILNEVKNLSLRVIGTSLPSVAMRHLPSKEWRSFLSLKNAAKVS